MSPARDADDLVPGRSSGAWPPARSADEILPRRPEEHRGWLLEAAGAALRGLTWLSPLPVGRSRWWWGLARPAGRALAETYVVVWLAVLAACLVAADTAAGPYVAGLALFRAGDLLLAQATVLLDPVGVAVGDPRRALALLGLHVAELVLVVAVVFRWQLEQRASAALLSGFEAVTLQGPGAQAGNWLDAARVLGGVGALLLGVAVVVAAVRLARRP